MNKLQSGKTKEIRPDQVIPFDDDFKDFQLLTVDVAGTGYLEFKCPVQQQHY